MFNKKCTNCGEKLSGKYHFCPKCGSHIPHTNNLGMLGRDDFIPSPEEFKFPRGFNMIFSSLLKNLDKQFKEVDKEIGKEVNKPKIRKGGLSISISTSGDKPPEIKVRSMGNDPRFKKEEEKMKNQLKGTKKLPQKKLKTEKLPKKEPKTNIRRLADKIIYEVNLPGVRSVKDVSIVQLENSIEVKAIAKDKAYIKLIPINLPIIDYSLEKGKLVLELDSEVK